MPTPPSPSRHPIAVSWATRGLIIALNAVVIPFIILLGAGFVEAKPPGLEWLGIGVLALVLLVADVLAVPLLLIHEVSTDEDGITVRLGLHRTRIGYGDILWIARRAPSLTAIQWKPTASRYLFLHTRYGDEALSIEDEAAFLETVRRHRPHITISDHPPTSENTSR